MVQIPFFKAYCVGKLLELLTINEVKVNVTVLAHMVSFMHMVLCYVSFAFSQVCVYHIQMSAHDFRLSQWSLTTDQVVVHQTVHCRLCHWYVHVQSSALIISHCSAYIFSQGALLCGCGNRIVTVTAVVAHQH